MIKVNDAILNGNAVKRVFPGSTASQLNHYVHASLEDDKSNTVIICAGSNNFTKKKQNAEDITKEIISIVETCCSGGVKTIFISSLTCRPSYQREINKLLMYYAGIYNYTNIDNSCIRNEHLWKDGLHLNKEGISILAENYITHLDKPFLLPYVKIWDWPNMRDSSTHPYARTDYQGDDYLQINVSYFSFSLFCMIISICTSLIIIATNIEKPTHKNEDEYEGCELDQLRHLRINNPKKVTMGHLNINSLPNKLGIMDMVANDLDIFLISETRIDSSFHDAQFLYKGFSRPYRKDRTLGGGGGGGLLMYVNEIIPSRALHEHSIPDHIEILCVEINLRKQKWVLLGIIFFFDHLSRVVDFYSTTFDRVVISGDFNSEPADEHVGSLFASYDLHDLVKAKTCFKGPPKYYDIILTNRKHTFQNTLALISGFSDFHKMTVTVLKTEFVKADPIQINYRDYNKFNPFIFKKDLKTRLNIDGSSNGNYSRFQNILREVLDYHAPIKKKYNRANNSSFMTKNLRKMIMNRFRCKNTYFKNKTVENWEKYRKLRNDCFKLTKKVKREYFQNLNIKSINDNKTFWKTVRTKERLF